MKILRVSMNDRKISLDEVPESYAGLGGRGLTSILINAEVPAKCDPLGPENKLVFAPGLLSGTPLVNTSRVSIGAKSPLTGTIKESNAGGTMAVALAKLGLGAIVVEESPAPDGLFFLVVDQNGKARLDSAAHCKGMRTYALTAKLFETYGNDNAVMCMGPAGEYQLSSASIQTTDVDRRPCRAAGRGGLGAVMGAKGLKAVVVSQQGQALDTPGDMKAFKEAAKTFAQSIKANPFTGKMLPAVGTAGLVGAVNSLGGFPCYNATKGVFEGWEKISGEAMAETIKKRGGKTTHLGCSSCIIHCSNEFVDQKGAYVTSSLEYETIWAMGGMTGIDDLDTIAGLDFLCDDIGLDTINTGVALAVAMDAGYKPFGDGAAALEMLEDIAKGTEMGKIIGHGPVAVGKRFKHHRVPVAKGQSIAAYDPRAMQGNGVTYATSPMGADHTAGNLIGEYLGGKLDPLSTQGQVAASRRSQITMAALDTIGLCLLASGAMAMPGAMEAMMRMVSLKLGVEFGPEDYQALGVRILKAELEFNRKAGFTAKDDRLAKFFYDEPLPPHNKVFLIPDKELAQTLKL